MIQIALFDQTPYWDQKTPAQKEALLHLLAARCHSYMKKHAPPGSRSAAYIAANKPRKLARSNGEHIEIDVPDYFHEELRREVENYWMPSYAFKEIRKAMRVGCSFIWMEDKRQEEQELQARTKKYLTNLKR